jgi:hypothetical protein
MPTIPITLIKGDVHGTETDYRDNLPVNMYAVMRNILGAQGYMIQYPGLTSFGTGQGIDRGGVYNERLIDHYRVSGTRFIKVASDGTVTNVGEITGSDQVALPYSFNTQAIIADGKMWLYNGSTLSEVTDSDLGDPIDGIWINGYYFLTDGEYIYHTDIDDETAIDPLKFATAEFMPDKSLGLLKTTDNKVAVFGRYSIEYFADAANANFAFTRIEARAQKLGIVSTHAKCEHKGVFYIVGGSKEEAIGVHKVIAGSSVKVSTREVDKVLSAYTETELADIRLELYEINDIVFLLVHLPNETLCFNVNLNDPSISWSLLRTDILTTNPIRSINHIFDARAGKWICGDKRDSTIGEVDITVATHYGSNVEWSLYTPFVNLEKFSIDEIEIETIPGFAPVGSTPTVAFSLTYDGVFFGTEHWTDYGDKSEYNVRFIARRLGYIGSWVGFKFRGTSDARMTFSLFTLSVS